jgi:hypothetical protein
MFEPGYILKIDIRNKLSCYCSLKDGKLMKNNTMINIMLRWSVNKYKICTCTCIIKRKIATVVEILVF